MEARHVMRERSRPFELALRIRHPSMDPGAISRELRLEPEHSFKAGEARESSSGLAATAVHSESYWLATLDPKEWTVEPFAAFEFPGRPPPVLAKQRLRAMVTDSLGLALTLISTHILRAHADFLRRLQSEGGDVGLIVEVPSAAAHSFTLTPQVAKVLCELGMFIDFEFTSD